MTDECIPGGLRLPRMLLHDANDVGDAERHPLLLGVLLQLRPLPALRHRLRKDSQITSTDGGARVSRERIPGILISMLSQAST